MAVSCSTGKKSEDGRRPFCQTAMRQENHPGQPASIWLVVFAETLGLMPHYQALPSANLKSNICDPPVVELSYPGDKEDSVILLL